MNIERIRQIATEFREGLLNGKPTPGLCFAVCAPLAGYLDFAERLQTKLIEVDFPHTNHVWIELDENTILDPTADQFGLAPVYIGPVPDQYLKWMREAING